MRHAGWIAAAGLFFAGCASSPALLQPVPGGWVKIEEDRQAERFVIRLENGGKRAFCVASSQWPKMGYVRSRGTFDPDDSYLVEDGRYIRARRYTAYPFRDPYTLVRVPPGEASMGFIYFDQFPGADFSKPSSTRRLHIPLVVRRCWSGIVEKKAEPSEIASERARLNRDQSFRSMILERAPEDMTQPLPAVAPSRP